MRSVSDPNTTAAARSPVSLTTSTTSRHDHANVGDERILSNCFQTVAINRPAAHTHTNDNAGDHFDDDEEVDAHDEIVAVHAIENTLLRFVPSPFRFDNAPIEATALSVDIFARATIIMSSMFLGPALLRLASDAAKENCDTSADTTSECRVYGFRPSSLLTNIAIAAGLSVCVLLPVFGAIVDHTQYRRQVGAVTAAGLVIVKGIEVGVGPRTWFIVALLQVFSSLLYNPHITATYAYTSELSDDPLQQTFYNTQLIVTLYCSTLLFLFEVLGLSALFGTDDVGTARISLFLTSLTSAFLFYFAWKYLFRDRPPLSQIPEGMNLFTCGFRKVLNTASQIRRHHPALKWFMLSIMFSEAGQGALITVATTFMTQVLYMNASEVGLCFLVVLMTGIPGSRLGGWIATRFQNPLVSAKLCDCYFILVTIGASIFLTGPEKKNLIYLFGALWGMALGWLPPIHTSIYISIIPKGQEAELMGTYLLCGQIIAWLPPLIFTFLNESGFDMAYGLGSLNLFFLFALGFLLTMGDYHQALNEARAQTLVPQVEII